MPLSWNWLRRRQPRPAAVKPLLVASVFAPSERNADWLRLQRRFLRQTVGEFDHAVYLNRVAPAGFEGSIVIGQSTATEHRAKVEHGLALNRVVAYFRAHPEYANYLILDSDAFPIQAGWLDELRKWMLGDDELPAKLFAAAVRVEKHDTFPHPCAFFIRGDYFERYDLDFLPRPYVSLAGRPNEQPGSGISPWRGGKHVFLPLLRTNARNPHPLLAAIYGGIFYHHGCGSRLPQKLAGRLRHAGHVLSQEEFVATEQRLYAELVNDPERFVNSLQAA